MTGRGDREDPELGCCGEAGCPPECAAVPLFAEGFGAAQAAPRERYGIED